MPDYAGEQRVHADARFAIIASRWNPGIVDALIDGARRTLREDGVAAAMSALGCVVRGDTRHYEHVADGCAEGLMRVSVDYRLPVLNGVLAVEVHQDAQARAGGGDGNKGADGARAALEI